MKPEKCEFHKEEVRYMRLIIGRGRVRMDPNKVAAVQDWSVPQSTFDVQSFIEFTNLYGHFIRNFSVIVHPQTALTLTDIKFKWSEECQRVFEMLSEAFVMASSVLAHFD